MLITDVRMPGTEGLRLLEIARRDQPELPVIVMTAHTDLDHAVAAYRGGAFEYLPKPFDIDEAVALVRRAAAPRRRRSPPTAAARRYPSILGQAPAMQEVFRAIGRLSRSSLSVLVTGESGTGKELVARALHRHSPRANGPFIALNTSAIAAELLESELFGHEQGAFTGADAHAPRALRAGGRRHAVPRRDRRHAAALQVRLLRVLAEGEFYRVGGKSPIRVDVRVIAATHQDLDALREAGAVPRGPAAPAQRGPHPTCRRCASGAGDIPELLDALPRARRARARRRAEDAARRSGRAAASSPSPGPATCASS